MKFNTCEECFKSKYKKDRCPYQLAKELIESYQYFKNEYSMDMTSLMQQVEPLKQVAQQCRADMNRKIEEQEYLRKVLGIDEMNKQITSIRETMSKIITDGGQLKKQRKQLRPGVWRMWRPDISTSKVEDAIKKLKKKYPSIDTNTQVEISENKNGNATIKYKLTDEE